MIVLLLRLYWEFLLIGMFSMGGGMATVPFLLSLSQRTAWFSTADLTTMIAISEATPGPIGVNMATYVGYISAGLPGGIVAPLGADHTGLYYHPAGVEDHEHPLAEPQGPGSLLRPAPRPLWASSQRRPSPSAPSPSSARKTA